MLFCCFILLIRNDLVFNYKTRALKMTSEKSIKAILDDYPNWEKFYNLYESYGSYNKMMLNLKKWTFKDFYPDLENKLNSITKDDESS